MHERNAVSVRTKVSVDFGAWILVAGSAAGLALSVFEYFAPGNGINHTWGVLLVVISTALLLAASLLMALYRSKGLWLRLFLNVATFLGLIGTGCAAYFLESHGLIGLMILGLVGWLIHVFIGPDENSPRHTTGDRSQVAL